MEPEKDTNKISIDVNCNDFFNKVQDEIEFDLARLKKNVEVINNLRMTAAEMEVEAAALIHAELLYHVEQLEISGKELNVEVANYNAFKRNKQELSNKEDNRME